MLDYAVDCLRGRRRQAHITQTTLVGVTMEHHRSQLPDFRESSHLFGPSLSQESIFEKLTIDDDISSVRLEMRHGVSLKRLVVSESFGTKGTLDGFYAYRVFANGRNADGGWH